VFEPALFSPLAIPCSEIPARLALVVWGHFLVFAMLEFAVVAGKTAPWCVIVLTNPPRF
jgi:hypothetical protein